MTGDAFLNPPTIRAEPLIRPVPATHVMNDIYMGLDWEGDVRKPKGNALFVRDGCS